MYDQKTLDLYKDHPWEKFHERRLFNRTGKLGSTMLGQVLVVEMSDLNGERIWVGKEGQVYPD